MIMLMTVRGNDDQHSDDDEDDDDGVFAHRSQGHGI